MRGSFPGWLGLAVLASASGLAHAGTVAGSLPSADASVAIDIGNNGQTDYSLDLSALLQLDPLTNTVSIGLAQGSVSDTQGQWANATFTAGGKTYSGVSWHSWLTASGQQGTTDPTTDPWATTLMVGLTGNLDPEMSYGLFVKNNTNAAQAYTVTFGEDIVPVTVGSYMLQADFSGTVSSVSSSPGVSLQPNTPSGRMQELYLRQASDGSYVNAGVNVGDAFANGVAGSFSYPRVVSDLVYGEATGPGIDHWEFRTRFVLSGDKDSFAASGTAVMTPVPEPASFWLGMGALMLICGQGILRRMRR